MLSETSGLGERELTAIAELEGRVVGYDGSRLKLEWPTLRERPSREVNDLLCWEGDALVGFLGLYSFGRQLELAGMVDPRARRRGIGTALVDRALGIAQARSFGKALLVVPTSGEAGRLFAQSKGAALDHTEHFLVLSEAPRGPAAHQEVVVRAAAPADDSAIVRVRSLAFGEQWAHLGPESPTEHQLVVERHGTVIGTLRVSTDGAAAGIYGFAIEPASQGQGIGREVLRRVCNRALADGAAQVTLEVALDNERALGLYTSVGFRQQATEEYWALLTT
ncbi:MAG: GNAT family N-acetyltransferase [Acidimicrobiales bacterium]